jgi:streptogramin lyase
MRVSFAVGLFSGVLALAGCARMQSSGTSSMNSPQGAAISGRVHGGQNPIKGAHVYLMAVNTTGYGGPGIAASSANKSASVLTTGAGQDSLGYYVTTDSNGNFNITGDYTCPSTWAHPYLYAVGGDSGSGANSAITLTAPVGSCPGASEFITVNEVSTIASAYAFAGFASDPTHVSTSSSAFDATAATNAANTILNLENPNTGLAYATTPGGNGTVPQAEIDTLANILAACINSTGPGSTQCSTLFSNAMNGGTQPTDTATAAVNLAHNPGANAGNLFGLQTPSSPFQPVLASAPNDFTIAVFYAGGGMNDPLGLAIDGGGDVWTTNTNGGANSLSEVSPVGVAISSAGGFTGGGLNVPYGIAIDSAGKVWAVNSSNNTLSEFNSSGTPASATAFSGAGLASPTNVCIDAGGDLWINNAFANNVSEFSSSGVAATNSPFSGGGINGGIDIACDAEGHVWISNSNAVLGELTTSGGVVTSGGYTGGGLNQSYGIAVDGSGNVWTANSGNNSISKFNSSGVAQSGSSGYTGGGLTSPQYIAVDRAGNVWVANEGSHSISEFNSGGTAITGSNGYQLPTTAVTRELAIDGSGNIWATSYNVNILTEFVGLASPVVTPTAANLTGSPVAPAITNIQPNPAAVGTSVTITGTNFGATQGGSTVTFNGTTASPTSWSATSITALVPVGATTGNVVVTVGGLASNGYSFTVSPPAPDITNIQPNPATVGTSVTITGTNFGATQGGSTVTFNGTTASPTSWGATSITVPVPTGATTGDVVVTVGGQASTGYLFTVTASALPGDSVTWRYNNSRDGLNPNETTLTTANVNSTTFGKVGEFTVDGRIDGEVLYVGQISISGTLKNVIYFATENDTVYAVDADSISGTTATVLWSKSLVPSGEAPATQQQTGGGCGNVSPVGVLGTPVIDRGRNAIYAVAKTMSSTTNTSQFFRIYALDLTDGNELFGGPTTVSATYPGTKGNVSGGVVTFSARDQYNRPGLLETGGNIYVAFGGVYGDCGLYSGFLISYNADTLAQSGVIDLNPNSTEGGMWNGQAGPSADTAGSVYVVTGNTGDTTTLGANDYPNSVVRLTNSGTLSIADYWIPYNTVAMNNGDVDLGSAGLLLLPDLVDSSSVVHHYAVAAGKDGKMYVVNRDNLGQFNSSTNSIVQTISIGGAENFSTPAYYNNNVYVCPSGQALKAYAISNALLATSATMSTTPTIGTAGFTISANGTSNGIIWAIQPTSGHGILYAFDASNLSTMLYASNQAASNRDQTAQIVGSFHTPTVGNGKVYFGTGSTVAVFGLLP